MFDAVVEAKVLCGLEKRCTRMKVMACQWCRGDVKMPGFSTCFVFHKSWQLPAGVVYASTCFGRTRGVLLTFPKGLSGAGEEQGDERLM